MSLPIYDLTPWDKVVQWGNAYHGHWRKNADGSIDPISGLTGEIIPVDPATMSKSVNTGPCWLTRFPGLQMPVTTQEEAAAGMYWTNYAVWSGTDLVYNSIINHPSITLENKKLLNKSSFQFVYRCEDKTVWWIYYEKSTKKLMASVPRTQMREVIFDMSSFDVPTWRNFSESGAKAAFGFLNSGASLSSWILEINIQGGSESTAPTATQDRFRTVNSGELIIDDFPSQPEFSELDDESQHIVIASLGSQIMDINWDGTIKTLPPMYEYPLDFWIVNGLGRRVTKQILFVDYDGDTPVDIGSSTEFSCQIEQYLIPGPPDNGNPTLMLTSSTFSTYISSIFRGSDEYTYLKTTLDCPHPNHVEIPNNPADETAARAANASQVVETVVINIGAPIPYEVTGPVKNSCGPLNLYSKYLVLAKDGVPYTIWNGERIYQYYQKTMFYGFVSSKGGALIPDGVEEKFNQFSVDPVAGTFTPGVIGYF